jgi:hypothetical protein
MGIEFTRIGLEGSSGANHTNTPVTLVVAPAVGALGACLQFSTKTIRGGTSWAGFEETSSKRACGNNTELTIRGLGRRFRFVVLVSAVRV